MDKKRIKGHVYKSQAWGKPSRNIGRYVRTRIKSDIKSRNFDRFARNVLAQRYFSKQVGLFILICITSQGSLYKYIQFPVNISFLYFFLIYFMFCFFVCLFSSSFFSLFQSHSYFPSFPAHFFSL